MSESPTINDGGPAFPQTDFHDYLLAKAMQGLLSRIPYSELNETSINTAIDTAFEVADAVIAERERRAKTSQ